MAGDRYMGGCRPYTAARLYREHHGRIMVDTIPVVAREVPIQYQLLKKIALFLRTSSAGLHQWHSLRCQRSLRE